MNKLKCSVTTCRHNANDLCELRKIQVDGPAALESRETCCGSYAERTASSENSCGCSSSPSATADVHCSAEHCTYNDNHKCSADCVCVAVAQTQRSSARRNAARLNAERNRF